MRCMVQISRVGMVGFFVFAAFQQRFSSAVAISWDLATHVGVGTLLPVVRSYCMSKPRYYYHNSPICVGGSTVLLFSHFCQPGKIFRLFEQHIACAGLFFSPSELLISIYCERIHSDKTHGSDKGPLTPKLTFNSGLTWLLSLKYDIEGTPDNPPFKISHHVVFKSFPSCLSQPILWTFLCSLSLRSQGWCLPLIKPDPK